MIGEERVLEVLKEGLAQAPAEAEVVFTGGKESLTRCSQSQIHQNVAQEDYTIYVRVAEGKRTGVVQVNQLDAKVIAQAAQRALTIARRQPENPYFQGFPSPASYQPTHTYHPGVAEFGPQRRAEVLKEVFSRAAPQGVQLAGAFSLFEGEIAVVNTNGLSAYQPLSGAEVSLVFMSDQGMSRVEAFARTPQEIDFPGLTERGLARCFLDKNQAELPPGEYTVILEPPCVAEVLDWLSFTAFGSQAFLAGTSFLSGAIGKRALGENITIYDSAWEPEAQGLPFDFEGWPKRKVMLVEGGVNRGVVFDRVSAAKAGAEPTGHAGPPGSPWGAVPWNLCLAPGDSSLEEMIAGCRRGILVSHFHYVNGYLDTKRALMTGMTRYGTFLVEDGQITQALKNLRWTESMLKALSNVVAISRERTVLPRWGGAAFSIVPALMIEGFTFTGVQRE
jgi:predicted Zn-dependent protease